VDKTEKRKCLEKMLLDIPTHNETSIIRECKNDMIKRLQQQNTTLQAKLDIAVNGLKNIYEASPKESWQKEEARLALKTSRKVNETTNHR
jgi:hypothetical protein